VLFVSTALAAAALYAVACSDDSKDEPFDPTGGDAGGSLPEAQVNTKDSETPATVVRFAHLAADLDAVDFCYRTAKSGTFEGPVIGKGIGGPQRDAGPDARDGGDEGGIEDAAADDATTPDGGLPSVAPHTVTRYLTLESSGALTIALVPPGATSCVSPLFTADVTLDPGKLSTVAIVGRYGVETSDDGLGLVAFIDDGATLPAKARVRMVHAALGNGPKPASPALAARAVGAQTLTVATRIEPRKIASPSTTIPVDSLGYAAIAPVPAPAQLAVGGADALGMDAAVEGWVSQAGDLGLTGASLHTGFIVTGTSTPFEVLWCTDTSTTGDLTVCKLVK
jgi:hypothetical protein